LPKLGCFGLKIYHLATLALIQFAGNEHRLKCSGRGQTGVVWFLG
jgi:hypothetical protein